MHIQGCPCSSQFHSWMWAEVPAPILTLALLTWTKWWAPASTSKWQMGFNSAFKGLKTVTLYIIFRIMYGVRLSRISGKLCGIKVWLISKIFATFLKMISLKKFQSNGITLNHFSIRSFCRTLPKYTLRILPYFSRLSLSLSLSLSLKHIAIA
jgi:hypothetical protein